MAASDLRAFQEALSLLPEHLGEVRCRAISRTPILSLLGGLLSENEVGQLSLRPWPPLKQWERCLRLSKKLGCHCFGRLTRPEISFVIFKEDRLFTHLALPFSWEQRKWFWQTCHGPEWVSWHSLASHSPLRQPYRRWKPLWWDFSDSPPPPSFLLLSLQLKCLYLHSHQGLFMVDLLDNFLNPLKLFMALASDFTKSLQLRMEGVRRER